MFGPARVLEAEMAGTIVVGNHTHEEILDSLNAIDEVAVCTSAGDRLRARMMHFAVDDEFNFYLATMRNDPKTLQLANNPSLSLLVLDRRTEQNGWREVEVTGRAQLIGDGPERAKALELTATPSPIVAHLKANNATDILDFIKVTPTEVKMRIFGEIVAGMPPTVVEFAENAQAQNDLRDAWRRVRNWVTAARTISLLASVVPVTLGVTLAWHAGWEIGWALALLTVIAAVSIQAGTNLFNDYFDHRAGNDEANREFVRPFSGGSRVIQLGLATPAEILMLATGLTGVAVAIGVGLVVAGYPWLLAIGAAGLASGLLYTARPVFLAGRGLGEVMVALNYGVLMTIGAYYIQAGEVTWTATLASLPLAGLIALVLYINQFPDANADSRTGKRTLVVRLGRSRAALLYPVLGLLPFVAVVALVVAGEAPGASLISLGALPLVLRASMIVRRYHSEPFDLAPANALTAIAHLMGGLLFALGYVWDGVSRDGYVVAAVLSVAALGYVAYMYWSVERQRRVFAGVKGALN